MLGVIVNVITVILGSCIGLLFKKGIPEKVSSAAMIGLGACTLYIGISGSLCGENVLIVIAAVVLGVISGTLLNIDGAINKLAKSVETKFKKDGQSVSVAEGLVTVMFNKRDDEGNESTYEKTYSEDFACTNCGISFQELTPRMFSFNAPQGACPECNGIGSKMEIDPDLIVPDKTLTLNEGAIAPWSKSSKRENY